MDENENTSADIQAQLDAALKSIEALTKTNGDLKSEKTNISNTLNQRVKELEDEKLETAKRTGDIETVKAALEKQYLDQITQYQNDNKSLNDKLSEYLIDNSINAAIASNNVLPHMVRHARRELRDGVKVIEGVAMFGEQLLEDRINEFFTSEEAEHYIASPVSSGAGATGSTAKAVSWTNPPKTHSEKIAYDKWKKDHPAEAKANAVRWNMPHYG